MIGEYDMCFSKIFWTSKAKWEANLEHSLSMVTKLLENAIWYLLLLNLNWKG